LYYILILVCVIGPKTDSSAVDSKPAASARKKGKAGNISKKAAAEGV
jgi:hypothetical protein